MSPLSGGGDWINFTRGPGGITNECSGGLGTRSRINGATYFLTAWHCYNPADPRVWAENHASPTNGRYIGKVTGDDSQDDAAYIKTAVQPGVGSYIYSGGPGQDTTGRHVVGVREPRLGETVCTSGGVLRANCAVRLNEQRQIRIENPYANLVSPPITVYVGDPTGSSSTAVLARGDSGGPVFVAEGTQARVIALISASPADKRTTCPPYVPSNRFCYSEVEIVGIIDTLNTHNLDPVT